MYTSKFSIEDKKFSGTLDFYVIKNIVDMVKDKNSKYTVHSLIRDLLDLDAETIRNVLFESINRLNNIKKFEFEKLFIGLNDLELLEVTNNMIIFINKLMDKCIPMNESSEKKEVVFIDELDYECEEDWDFNHLEYLWNSTLNRKENFWSITPKNLFSQLDIYKKVNKIEDEKIQYV